MSQPRNWAGFFWNDNESRFSLIKEQRFRNTSSRPIMTEEVSPNWMKLSSLNDVKFIVLIKETNNIDEINNFFMNKHWNKNQELREDHVKSLNEMKELKRFQMSTFGGKLHEWFERFSRCWISKQWTIPCFQSTCVFTTSSSSWRNAKPFFRNVEPKTRMAYRETFLQFQRRLLQHLIRKGQIRGSPMRQNTRLHMWWVKAKHQFRIRDANQDRQSEIQSSQVRETF